MLFPDQRIGRHRIQSIEILRHEWSELDQIALSSLTLMADPRKLYQMRYVDLPQGYYLAYANGLANGVYWSDGTSGAAERSCRAVVCPTFLRFGCARFMGAV